MAIAPDQEWRRTRLDALAQHQEFGARAALGRALGYKDGAYVRQMIEGERPITEKTIAAVEALKGGMFRGWFARAADTRLSVTSAAAGSGAVLIQAEEQIRAILADDAVRQLLVDLADLPPSRRSQILDMVHGYAEDARAAHEHLMQRKLGADPAPKPAKAPSAAAARSGSKDRRSLRIRIGDGNPDQSSLELRIADDPFTAQPDERELELYQRIAKNKVHRQ